MAFECLLYLYESSILFSNMFYNVASRWDTYSDFLKSYPQNENLHILASGIREMI